MRQAFQLQLYGLWSILALCDDAKCSCITGSSHLIQFRCNMILVVGTRKVTSYTKIAWLSKSPHIVVRFHITSFFLVPSCMFGKDPLQLNPSLLLSRNAIFILGNSSCIVVLLCLSKKLKKQDRNNDKILKNDLTKPLMHIN